MRGSLVCLVAYVAAMVVGRLVVLETTGLALLWPAAGVAALWLLQARTRPQLVRDAALLFGATVLFFAVGVGSGVLVSVLLGIANLVQAAIVRVVFARARGHSLFGYLRPAVSDSRDMRTLVLAAGLAAFAGAPIGALAAAVQAGELAWSVPANWAIRNVCGILVPTLVVLSLAGARTPGRAFSWPRRLAIEPRQHAPLELSLAVLITLGAGAVVTIEPEQVPVAYVLMGSAAWVGFRFVPVVGALYSLVFATIAVLLTFEGLGPFGTIDDLALRAAGVQLFVAMTALLVLLFAFGVTDRAVLASRLREAEARATRRADLLDAVNGALVDGLCVSDSRGHVLLANAAAAELGGADGHGRHVHDGSNAEFYWPDGSPVAPEDFPHARALAGEPVAMTDVVRRNPLTGHEQVLAVSAVPLHFEAGDVTQDVAADDDAAVAASGPLAVVLMRDVTEQRAQHRALESFVGVVAHDLKGPLTSVSSWTEMARDQLAAGTEAQTVAAGRSVERIQATAGRMNHLITDLLDYTVAGSAELHVRTLDLDAFVDSIVRDLELPGGGVVVEHAELGEVVADPVLTRQLFANLIGNAVKFVAPGERPHVLIESVTRGDVREIRLSDNGVGISASDRGRVFDAFFRSGKTGSFPGSGLGLAICLRAVERHGGSITAQEGPGGQGTTMVFTLPLSQPAPVEAPRLSATDVSVT
ncbi:MAG: ATP-binding protein [Marmoricola sp.]